MSRRRRRGGVIKSPQVVVSVGASADDGVEVVSTTVVSIVGTAIGLQPDRLAGFRFLTPLLPQGATITSAYIQFTSSLTLNVSAVGRDACVMSIWGEDADAAAAFAAVNTNISSRAKTTATVLWSHPSLQPDLADWNAGRRGYEQRTPNLATIVQEVVDRPGFNGVLAFLITQDQGGDGNRQVVAFDHLTLPEPALSVAFS